MNIPLLKRTLVGVGLLAIGLRPAVCRPVQVQAATASRHTASRPAKEAMAPTEPVSEREALLALAKRNEAQGNFPEAIRQYRAYLSRYPDDEAVRFRLATVLGWNKQFSESESMLRTWAARHPADADGILQLGRVLSWEEKYPESANEYKHALALRPSDVRARTEYAGVLLILQNYTEASRQYQEVLNVQPTNAEAEVGIIRTRIAMRATEQAQTAFTDFAREHPHDPRLSALRDQMREAQLARAASLPFPQQNLQALVQRDPHSARLRLALADQYLEKRDFDAAAAELRAASELQPANDSLLLRRARVLSWAKKYDESIRLYREWLTKHPRDPKGEMELARVLSWSRNYDGAVAEYQKILSWDPDDRQARLEMARVLGWDKQYGRALDELQLLLKAKPNEFDALLLQAQIYSYQARWKDSLRVYNAALQIRPADRDALTGKAQVLVWSGEPAAARPLLENLRKRDPKDVRALVVLASDENALRRPDLALKLLRQADALAPGDNDVATVRGAIAMGQAPELTIGWNYTRDTEGLNAWRYQVADFRFNLTPRIRSFITAEILPTSGLASIFAVPVSGTTLYAGRLPEGLVPAPGFLQAGNLPSEALIPGNERSFQWATEIEGGATVRINHWFSSTAGAGVATLHHGTGDLGGGAFPGSRSRPIYDAGITFYTSHWEFDVRSSRHYWAYTPRAIEQEIHADEQNATITWSPNLHTHFAITGYHRRISPPLEIQDVPVPGSGGVFQGRVFTIHGNGATLRATRDIMRREYGTLTLGYEGIVFGYTHPSGLPFSTYLVNPGVFTPSFYQRQAATFELRLNLPHKVRWNVHGSAGSQQIFQGSDFSFSSTAGTRFDLPIGPKTTLSLGYDYFNTASATQVVTFVTRGAAYHNNSVSARMHFRF
jgi:tetratricopeptide (TPR) repeat protein